MSTTVYRNYGQLGYVTPSNNAVEVNPRRLVYQATHKGDGTRLPFMYRSFISFTYGGKYIEDFDLVATIVSNRLTKPGYAPFNDITTTYDNLDGQYYWNTHYNANALTFVLATDGIEQKTLDEFLFWFHAGEAKELILSEHPNRAIMARVAQPPQLSLLPFEHDTIITISSIEYTTKTTLYKGEITLDFVMDEPHWYAKLNILGREDIELNRIIDEWYDPAKEEYVEIFSSKDALKILVEDGIPLGSMIDLNMLLGNGAYANVENNTDSLIWRWPDGQDNVYVDGEPLGVGARINGEITILEYAERSRFAMASENFDLISTETETELLFDKDDNFVSDYREYYYGTYKGIIAGPIIDVGGQGIESLATNDNGYFFYSGTAPSPTIISFDITPTFDNDGYMNMINNSITSANKPYNTITIESINKLELQLTTPNLITSYNKALNILYTSISNGKVVEEILKEIILLVRHPAIRTWVNSLLSTDNLSLVSVNTIKSRMMQFFKETETTYTPMHFVFNSKTGSALGEFKYRRPTSLLSLTNSTEPINISELLEVTEDVGDMLKSNNIIIHDRNYPNENGKIVHWQNTIQGKTYSHRIYHDFSSAISNLQIQYRNMYL